MSSGRSGQFRPQQTGLKQILGDLEADIMEVMWVRGHATVREVHDALLTMRNPDLAYTTVMTVMTRLAEKELLSREAAGNTYIYAPRSSREVYLAGVVGEVLDALLVSHREQTISHLVDRFGDVDASELDRLERALALRRGSSS